jgi:predicted small secreted protein
MFKRTTMLALTLFALLCAAPLLGACHTTAGAGEDISDAGHVIQHDADHGTP